METKDGFISLDWVWNKPLWLKISMVGVIEEEMWEEGDEMRVFALVYVGRHSYLVRDKKEDIMRVIWEYERREK